jgi:2-oxoglutarate dehydrogenase E2 component (dihydrolipoamide succinyltransferase)
MSIEIKVPVLPESVADAVIASWYKKAGESIHQDEKLVDLETDKVILEVPSISNGVVKEILFKEGDVVTSNQVLAVIDETEAIEEPIEESTEKSTKQGAQAELNTSPEPVTEKSLPPISPSARKMMEENNISSESVTGSGRSGRILKEDVQKKLSEMEDKPHQSVSQPASRPEVQKEAIQKEPVRQATAEGRIEQRVPMTRLRARIAERLLGAQHDAAILTTFNEVNMKPVMELRSRYKDKFEKEYGVRLGFMSFFVKASVEALKQFPDINASIDGNDIVYHGFFDIGVAVSGPSGLVVPVLRDADQMSVAEIEKTILDFATKAKNNALSMEDITGGTFTISNGGVFGSMLSTPILNPPQSAILGMHTIKERAMVVDGEITVLPMMYLALSYDHRIIDGSGAVQFLVTIRDLLEDPSRMLLGI